MKNAEEAKRVLGRKIASLRKQAGLTQSELAEKWQVSDNFVGQIERGQKAPSLENLVRVANVLKVEVSELFRAKSLQSPDLPLKSGKEIDELVLAVKDLAPANIRLVKKFVDLFFREYLKKS